MKSIDSYTHIVWDFNGTILDDLAQSIGAVNRLLTEQSLPTLNTPDDYYRVFGFPIEDYYRRLGLLENESYTVLAHRWVANYRDGEEHIPMRRGVDRILQAVKARGITQSVLSATEENMLLTQLSYLGLGDLFENVLGRTDIYATDKTGIALRFREAHPADRVLMIGDTDHDLATARAADFDCVLVCGGHQSRAHLETLGCHVTDNFDTLFEELGL